MGLVAWLKQDTPCCLLGVRLASLGRGVMTDRQGEDEETAADMALIEALANGLHHGRWPGDADTIVELGDMEVTSLLARRHGGYTVETTNRGKRSVEAVFGTARDARRHLIMELCEEYRFHWFMPPLVMRRLAAR